MLKKSILFSLVLLFILNPIKLNEESITTYEEKQYNNYLVIPKLNFKKEFYPLKDKRNNVDNNIEVLNNSVMPNKIGNMYIAGHSGVGNKAFFNDLFKLKKEDKLIIIYKNKEYIYEITDIYNEKKDHDIKVNYNKNSNYLILTTCNKYFKEKQLVIKAQILQ
ncbi:MAG: sortase [Bacilli bacterium]